MKRFLLLVLLGACGSPEGKHARPDEADLGAAVDPLERQVTFPGAGIDLEGTLHLPARRERERVPAVVLVHGSGPNSRDAAMQGQLGMTFGFTLRLFAELATALQEAGYAVLRYDKRTCGSFNGCAANGYPLPDLETHLVDEYIEDADAALAYLASLPEIDPARLFHLGHSEGASFAPQVLDRRAAVRGGVMLGGPFQSIEEVLHLQSVKLRELLQELGTPRHLIDEELADLEALVAALRDLRAGRFAGEEIDGLPVAFWRSWQAVTDRAREAAPRLERPLLMLHGDYDWNVPASEGELWRAFLGSETPHEIVSLPCVTHAMNCISQPDWTLLTPADVGRRVHPGVVEAVVGFLDRNR